MKKPIRFENVTLSVWLTRIVNISRWDHFFTNTKPPPDKTAFTQLDDESNAPRWLTWQGQTIIDTRARIEIKITHVFLRSLHVEMCPFIKYVRGAYAIVVRSSPQRILLIDTHIVFLKQPFFYTFRDFSFLLGSFVEVLSVWRQAGINKIYIYFQNIRHLLWRVRVGVWTFCTLNFFRAFQIFLFK